MVDRTPCTMLSSSRCWRGLASWVRPGLKAQPLSKQPKSWLSEALEPQLMSPWRSTLGRRAMSARRTAATPQSTAAVAEDEDDQRIIETELRHEAEQSYLSYAMSVIVGRALPDARDGLKPVHRRILYAMHELGLQPNKPFRKCARVVGEVLGKFHPHGDTAVYDALVRMAQDFAMRAPLVNGHGNFGSLDDDPAAAMRYTECRLQPVAAAALLADLDSETVQFLPNFDASTEEPAVLPAKIPNLLINGSSGIAVGIATKIPPHNMKEVVQGLIALIRNPEITVAELMRHIPAPDFPTGGVIISTDGLLDAYQHGRGTILVRAKVHVEDSTKKKPLIVITELPYQTNKAALVEQIAKFVDDGKITGVSDIRDESDRSGMRVVVELKRGATTDLTMNQLLKHTTLQTRFSCNMIGLVDGLPKTLTLKDFLQTFLDFRCQVVEDRAAFELKRATSRLHLVDGFLIAMHNMTEVVNIIRNANDSESAIEQLQTSFSLSKEQADGVMSLTLRRLTSLEGKKLEEEQGTLRLKIEDLEDLLQNKDRVFQMVEDEAVEVAERYGDERRTTIMRDDGQAALREVDIIPNDSSIIIYSRKGYIKRMNADNFAVQGIRGQGKAGARLKDEDTLEDVIHVNDHDCLLFFTTEGHVHSLYAYQVPEASRTAAGTAITQILRIKPSSMAAMLPVHGQFDSDMDIVLLTSNGQLKRVALDQFSKVNAAGIRAMTLKENDTLRFVSICSGTDSVLLSSSLGMALHISISDLRRQSRTAMGVRAMNVGGGHFVGMSVLPKGVAPEEAENEDEDDSEAHDDNEPPSTASGEGPWLFTITKKGGLGKRTPIELYPVSGRIGKGRKAVRLAADDSLAAALVVGASGTSEDLLISTLHGMLLRVPVDQCKIMSRITKGYRVVRLRDGDEVVAVTKISSNE